MQARTLRFTRRSRASNFGRSSWMTTPWSPTSLGRAPQLRLRIRRDRHVHPDILKSRQQVDIAGHKRRSGLHDEVPLLLKESLHDPARQPKPLLERLIRVRRRAHENTLAAKVRAGHLFNRID